MNKNRSLMSSLAAFFLMMAMAVTTSALSFFVAPVCEDLALGRGSFTLYMSLMTVSAAICTPFLGQYINRRGVKTIVLISGLWCSAGLMLFSFSDSLWMFYAVAAIMGMFATSCVSLCANVIVQQTFTGGQASGVLGLVMSGSGVGGMILSLIVPNLISSLGWRTGYRFLSLCWLVLVLGAFFLLGKQETSGGIGQRRTPIDGMTRAEALRSPLLYLLMIAIVTMTACSGIQQQVPSLLSGMGFGTGEVSLMLSVMTACLALGKILQGLLYSKLGIARGTVIMLILYGASYVLLMDASTVWSGLVTLAFGIGTITTLMPTVTRMIFGSREYPAIWSVLSTSSNVGSFATLPLWGMVYDATGSYQLALMASPVLIAIALGAMLLAFRKKKG